ncbi:hypothetical protein BJ986_000612 [Phycicoccus badiiscoriae]|uniref:NERD domain-containing protein n=1 Tax=Pedococcus badiiscoriae TaxID=642776 RepID=A0A852WIM6_9MICO|nr:hypothetical protein [Pedococcus badiiscoriae]NYG06125.1 hypothetical protein [Pedococcus badiiscoriae]
MVPQIVRLERAGVCGCGELVPAGEQAGYAAAYESVMCLDCLAAEWPESRPVEAVRNGPAVVPAVWTTDAMIIEATLKALREGSGPTPGKPAPEVLHVPTEWSSLKAPVPADEPASAEPDAAGPDAPARQDAPASDQLITLPQRKPRSQQSRPADPAAPPVDETFDDTFAEPFDGTVEPVGEVVDELVDETAVAEPVDEPLALAAEVAELPAEVAAAATAPAVLPAIDVPATPASTADPAAGEAQTRRSRHEAAAVQDLAMPAAAPRRRAGLFSRLLTVRSFRTQQSQPKVSKSHVAVRSLLGAATAKGVLTLHNRRVPGRRGPIEHIAIGASGVYVIDALHFKNASIEVRPSDGVDGSGDDLVVGGRVMNPAVRAVAQRVEVLRLILVAAGLDNVPVTGALCFVDGLLPLGVADLEVGGMHVLRPSGLTALVAGPGMFGPEDRQTLLDFLAERLPAVA